MKTQILTLTAAIAISSSSFASDSFAPGDTQSKWVVGGSLGVISNPLKGEDNIGLLLPKVEYRGERLFVRDGQLGFNLLEQSGFSTGLVLTGQTSFLYDDDEYDDNPVLAGLKEREGTIDAGLYLAHSSELGRLQFTVLEEVSGEHDGQTADLNYVFDLSYNNWRINPVIGATWNSSDSVNYFYGISQAETNANRAAYKGDSTVNPYAGIRGRYLIDKNWELDMQANYVHLGDGISDSSIVEDDHVASLTVGVNYNF